MQVAEDVYDLRCSAAYLGEQTGLPSYQRSTFSAGFSRAVRGLVARQQLTPLWLVPLLRVDPDYPDGVEHLADGAYLMWHSRQIRFVKR